MALRVDGALTGSSDAIASSVIGAWNWLTWSPGGPNPATIAIPSAGVHTVNVRRARTASRSIGS